MPIDQTSYFKARIKTLLQRQKKEKSSSPIEEPRYEGSQPTAALSAYKNLVSISQAISKGIFEFSLLLWTQRKDYLSCNILNNGMSNEERDRFDQDCEKTLRHLEDSISKLKKRNDSLHSKEQKHHMNSVAEFLNSELKKVAKIVTRMRILRVKGQATRQANTRLSSLMKEFAEKKPEAYSLASSLSNEIRQRHGAKHRDNNSDYAFSEAKKSLLSSSNDSDDVKNTVSAKRGYNGEASRILPYCEDDNKGLVESEDLRPEEKAQLNIECEKMYDKFSHVNMEINSLETQLAEIQHLQDTFAEKIMDQEKDIELINETAIHTTENLKDGNEWIRQAISNSAGRRVVVLFCIIVITFTLLFLDWYNP